MVMPKDSDILISDANDVAVDWEAVGRLVRRGALGAVARHFAAEGVARSADGGAQGSHASHVEGGA